jgi:hypothetical protein
MRRYSDNMATDTNPREFTPARQSQGFRDQAHLDAFYAYYDHGQACQICGTAGTPYALDDGMQPTAIECATGRALFALSTR